MHSHLHSQLPHHSYLSSSGLLVPAGTQLTSSFLISLHACIDHMHLQEVSDLVPLQGTRSLLLHSHATCAPLPPAYQSFTLHRTVSCIHFLMKLVAVLQAVYSQDS
jgi:hypothetical protein